MLIVNQNKKQPLLKKNKDKNLMVKTKKMPIHLEAIYFIWV